MKTRFAFHHVALSVADLSLSQEFYHRFGFHTLLEWQAEDGDVSIAQLKLGAMILELFCFAGNHGRMPTTETLWDNLRQPGPRHFALQVDALEQALAELQAEKIAPADATINEGKTGILYVFIRDPDGNFIEIAEDRRFT